MDFLVKSPQGETTLISALRFGTAEGRPSFKSFLDSVLQDALLNRSHPRCCCDHDAVSMPESTKRHLRRQAYLTHSGKILNQARFQSFFDDKNSIHSLIPPMLQLRFRIIGGMDRQNRVGSKFGGGGVSSAQQSERERKERLKQLALESIDLAKDPYLVRNHLGTYECKLCLTLHRDETNYLSHTQGKKHQAGLARRAYLDKLKAEREGKTAELEVSTAPEVQAPAPKKVRIGRPAYQVFKSREPDTQQRCLSFELQYPEIEEGLQPRHRFMSAFEQKVESPPDQRYQYLLFAAEPYDILAFKIPNEPIDKGENRFVTYWDEDSKKFIVTLYFLNPTSETKEDK